MAAKDLLDSIRQRIKYIKMTIEERDNLFNCSLTLWALRNDKGALNNGSASDSRLCHHYKFGTQGIGDPMGMSCDELNDFVASKIGSALKESKKATAMTLSHGDITDKGMADFLRGLEATEAPIKALYFNDLQQVTDKSLSALPEIIEKKGISVCEINLCRISPDLKKHINLACSKNQKVVMSKDNTKG